jgi:hypothetical protein
VSTKVDDDVDLSFQTEKELRQEQPILTHTIENSG